MELFFRELYIRHMTQATDARLAPRDQDDGLVEELRWKNNLQQRTTAVVTISFNTLAALLIIASILFQARKARNRKSAMGVLTKIRFLSYTHPTETFPLVISAAIVAQGIIFLGIQGIGLRSQSVGNCRAISQIVWPALWIVAYSLLVFGAEVAFRGFKKKRFHSRDRFSVITCWSIVLVMLLVTWVPSHVYKSPMNECSGSLLSWAVSWADIAIFLNSIILFLYVVIAFLIAYQLSHTARIDHNERLAATRTIYYLVIGILLMSGVLPFWAFAIRLQSTYVAANIATIALNIFGLLMVLLYLILRLNTSNMASRPVPTSWQQEQERGLFESPDFDIISKHSRNPSNATRSGTLHQRVLSSEKIHVVAHVLTARARSDPAATQSTPPIQVPPPYQTPMSLINGPTPNSPQRQRGPPIPSLEDLRILQSRSHFLSPNQINYTVSPPRSACASAMAQGHVKTLADKPVVAPAPLFFNRHERDTLNTTVQSGVTLSTGAVGHQIDEGINRAATYPPVTERSRLNHSTDQQRLSHRSLHGGQQILAPLAKLKSRARESSPHEILFRLNSNEELSAEPVRITGSAWTKPLEEVVSPTSGILSRLRFQDARMKSLPPVPLTPSEMRPPLLRYRASFSEPPTPLTPMRVSQERAALSLALNEDEHGPLDKFEVIAPKKPYIRDVYVPWI